MDKNIIKAQKTVAKFLIKKMGQNLLSGKSLVNVSLPV